MAYLQPRYSPRSDRGGSRAPALDLGEFTSHLPSWGSQPCSIDSSIPETEPTTPAQRILDDRNWRARKGIQVDLGEGAMDPMHRFRSNSDGLRLGIADRHWRARSGSDDVTLERYHPTSEDLMAAGILHRSRSGSDALDPLVPEHLTPKNSRRQMEPPSSHSSTMPAPRRRQGKPIFSAPGQMQRSRRRSITESKRSRSSTTPEIVSSSNFEGVENKMMPPGDEEMAPRRVSAGLQTKMMPGGIAQKTITQIIPLQPEIAPPALIQEAPSTRVLSHDSDFVCHADEYMHGSCLSSAVLRRKHLELYELQQQMIERPRRRRRSISERVACAEKELEALHAALRPRAASAEDPHKPRAEPKRHTRAMWVVDVSDWNPTEPEFQHLLSRYCDQDRAEKVTRFRQTEDQHRALLSTLLQRKACTDLAMTNPSDVLIARTKGSKPYAVLESDPARPNFNFNASHDGKFVALCAHSHFLCGIDIVEVADEPRLWEGLADTMSPTSQQHYNRMDPRMHAGYAQMLFGCKEAYTKAVGVGLMEDFAGINFVPQIPANWSMPFDGVKYGHFSVTTNTLQRGRVVTEHKGEWHLEVTWADRAHVVVTALGAPRHAVDALGGFKSQLVEPNSCPEPGAGVILGAVKKLTVEDLVPDAEREWFTSAFRNTMDLSVESGYSGYSSEGSDDVIDVLSYYR